MRERFELNRKGKWFGGGTSMCYISNHTSEELKNDVDSYKFYIINEQEFHLIRIRNEQQMLLMENCMYGPQLMDEDIQWLIEVAEFTYFDSVDDYIEHRKNFMIEFMKDIDDYK